MPEELRKFDTSIGKCVHCNQLVFKEDDITMPWPFRVEGKAMFAHRKCDNEYMAKASQI